MSRRTTASLVAVGLLVLFLVLAARPDVPFVKVSPGPTLNVLGDTSDDQPIVKVEGHQSYPSKGQLRLVTVSVTNPEARMDLLSALEGWLNPDVAVMPYAAMYPEATSNDVKRAESAAEMVNSQDTAVAVALRELGYKLPTYAEVTGVVPKGPADGVLKPRDRFVSIEGAPVKTPQDVIDTVQAKTPGEHVKGVVSRKVEGKDKKIPFDIETVAAPSDPKKARIGVTVGTGYEFPFEVSVRLNDDIGGPSAGLIFSLSVYDALTPGDLTDGKIIAGTGTIDADGSVGPIGGIAQKIVGARDAGAKVFLVPPDNCASALTANVDPEDIRLVKAPTFDSAVESLKKFAQDPNAKLPRCES